jgi:hypothetical protein
MTKFLLPFTMTAATFSMSPVQAQPRPLIDFPTANRAVLAGQPEQFYMHVNRDFEGEKTTPWEGGMYGFVRGPVRQGSGVVYLRHHEGIDISPLHRDPAGSPLDPILAAADGTVVHASEGAGDSNYGKYVVIEHVIEGSPYYSLYAHLGRITTQVGARVRQGEKIGVMGYTGVGLDRARAHLHFEFAFMISPHFAEWFPADAPRDPNPHGNFNGRNLIGVNPMALLAAARKNPAAFRLGNYLQSEPEAFRVIIPHTPAFTLVKRYPWLVEPGTPASPAAWVIGFSENGTPVRAAASDRPVAAPAVVSVSAPNGVPLARATRGLVGGSVAHPILTNAGTQMVRLLTEHPIAAGPAL